MTSLLVYRRPCEHGLIAPHVSGGFVPTDWSIDCPGGVDVPLDPDKVLAHVEDPFKNNVYFVTVKDVLDVLDREAT